MIVFDNVTKEYPGGTVALQDVSLRIEKGEFVFVLGRSGAGKSTFLKLVFREEMPTSGRIIVDGRDLAQLDKKQVPELRRRMGVVFQDFRLIPTMDVYDNVAFALRVTDVPEEQINEKVMKALEVVQLQEKKDRMPRELSGGEQQRVALARAVVHGPQLIIADEPTGNIDPAMSIEMMRLLMAINDQGPTVVVVTHEQELAHHFNKRTITIDDGQIIGDCPPVRPAECKDSEHSTGEVGQ